MLDDPRATNSTFVEGYSADGSLAYAPYADGARVSHAHGWSTGPTSVLTFHTAGLRLSGGWGRGAGAGEGAGWGAGGRSWVVAPRLGGLGAASAGFEAPRGRFAVEARGDPASEVVTALRFSTPEGTAGEVSLPGVEGVLRSDAGEVVVLVGGQASGVPGGSWTLVTSG